MRRASRLARFAAVVVVAIGCAVHVVRATPAVSPLVGDAAYVADSWTTEDGLPSNTIRALAQTPDGYIWLGTDAGIVRFDGVHFTLFGLNDGLGSTRVNSLFVDHQGALWVGTFGGGVSRLEGSQFRTWRTRDGLGSDNIAGFVEGTDGALWVQTQAGACRWTSGHFAAISAPDRPIEPRTPGRPVDLAGFVAVGAVPAGLLEVQSSSIRVRDVPASSGSAALNCLLVDRTGGVWCGSDAGLDCLRGGRWSEIGALARVGVASLADGGDGSVLIVDGMGNVRRWSEGKIAAVRFRPAGSIDLPIAMLTDRQGCIWLGTYREGLFRLRRERVTMLEADAGIQTLSIAERSDGSLWVGCVGNGLWRAMAGRLVRCDLGSAAWNSGTVFGVLADRDGGLWVADAGALLHWTPGHRAVSVLSSPMRPDENIRVLVDDAAGGVLLGTDHGRVLRVLRNRTTLVTDSLSGSRVSALLAEPDGTLWIGTYSGLHCLRGGAHSVFTTANGLSSSWIRTLYRSADGVLWVGTGGGGLSCRAQDRFTSFTSSQGLPNDFISQILQDDAGDFWFGCNRGIFRVSRDEMRALAAGRIHFVHAQSFGRSEGMRSEECTGNSGATSLKTRAGLLCFATYKGLAVVDPRLLAERQASPHVALETVAVDDSVRQGVPQRLVVPPGLHQVAIRYTSLGSLAPERVGFRYRMEGLEDWVEAGTYRAARYHGLPPGRYRFRLQARNGSDPWGPAEASMVVLVQPSVWQTWWLRTLLALLVGTGAYFWHRSRLLRQSRARRAQEQFSQRLIESQELERRRIAAELHDGLGHDLLLIQHRLRSIAGGREDRADLEGQIQEATEMASQAISNVRGVTSALRPAALEKLGLTGAIELMVEQVTAASTIQFSTQINDIDGLLEPDSGIHLYRIIQEALNNVIKHSGAQQAILELRREAAAIHLSVFDNGRGFVQADGPGRAGAPQGLGLIGMAERCKVLRGEMELQSAPGRGTRLTLTIPIREEAR